MSHDVFISHSQRDHATADAVRGGLEASGVRCWIAPRDIPAGQPWKTAIVAAIRDARVMVLVLSAEANASAQVQREVDIAFEARLPILPFRIEDVAMSDELLYCIGSRHRMDALTPDLASHVASLVSAVRALLGRPADPPITRARLFEESAERNPPRDAQDAVRRYRAAEQDDLEAQLALGDLYLKGRGVPVDYVESAKWYRRAAEQADMTARFCLGYLYETGYGVAKNDAEAARLYKLAADQGEPRAKNNLARMYLAGRGVQRNHELAYALFRAAADSGLAQATANLGYMFEHGHFVAANRTQAVGYYRAAAAAGNAWAAQQLARLGVS